MRRIRILAYPNSNLLDITGPAQVLASASQYAVARGVREEPSYDIDIVSLAGGAVLTSSNVALVTTIARLEPIDTLLVVGGHGADAACAQTPLLEYVRAQSALATRTGSICTGAFILAAAGLLDGRAAATHWGYCDQLATRFPNITVKPDAIYVEDGPYWTSAGVMAGVDLAFALVERDLGKAMANYTARALVTPVRRAAGEPQISARLEAWEAESDRIQNLMQWIADNPRANLSVTALADRAGVSVRGLQRHFAAMGRSPAAFVESARVEAARRLLVRTHEPLERVASLAGFTSAGAMQRAFVRVHGASPTHYRKSMIHS